MALDDNDEAGMVPPIALLLEGWFGVNGFGLRASSGHKNSKYAELVEPIAMGMLQLALAAGCHGTYVRDITELEGVLPSATSPSCGLRSKFLVLSEELRCDLSPVWFEGAWAPSGFGLHAVILEVGSDQAGQFATLSLVLPIWTATPEMAHRKHEFALISFNTRGHVQGARVHVFVNGMEKVALPLDHALKTLLGLTPRPRVGYKSFAYDDITECLGFPYAEEALLGKLPLLNRFFMACANRIRELFG